LITVARVTLLYSTAREVYQYHLPLRAFLITATPSTEISTLSLHDALPICIGAGPHCDGQVLVSYDMLGLFDTFVPKFVRQYAQLDRKSTRLNSSHQIISYAVFCLKKKKKN